MPFDPDAYLSAPVATPFNPDAYLSESAAPSKEFDPDAYLAGGVSPVLNPDGTRQGVNYDPVATGEIFKARGWGAPQESTFIPPAPVEPSGVMRRVVGDSAVALGQSIVAVPQAVTGILDIPTGGYAGKGLESLGVDFEKAQAGIGELYSPEAVAAQKKVSDAEGFIPTIKAAVQNPSTIANTLIQSSLPMLAGGAIGRVAKGIPAVAKWAGAIGEGAIGAGSSAEQIRSGSEDGTLSAKQVALSGGAGVVTALIGRLGAKASKYVGADDVDSFFAGTSVEGKKLTAKKLLKGMAIESGEEIGQSAEEQIAQNIATDRPWDEGVDNSMAMGALSGAIMSAGMNLATPGKPPTPPPAAPTIHEQAIAAGLPAEDALAIVDSPDPAAALAAALRPAAAPQVADSFVPDQAKGPAVEEFERSIIERNRPKQPEPKLYHGYVLRDGQYIYDPEAFAQEQAGKQPAAPVAPVIPEPIPIPAPAVEVPAGAKVVIPAVGSRIAKLTQKDFEDQWRDEQGIGFNDELNRSQRNALQDAYDAANPENALDSLPTGSRIKTSDDTVLYKGPDGIWYHDEGKDHLIAKPNSQNKQGSTILSHGDPQAVSDIPASKTATPISRPGAIPADPAGGLIPRGLSPAKAQGENLPIEPAPDKVNEGESFRTLTQEQIDENRRTLEELGIPPKKAAISPPPTVEPVVPTAPADKVEGAGGTVAKPRLAVKIEGVKTVRAIGDIGEASVVVKAMRESSNLGASEFPVVDIVDIDTGERVGTVMYNGKIVEFPENHPSRKIKQSETPAALPAPAPSFPDPVEVQKIKNSIQEGETIMRGTKNAKKRGYIEAQVNRDKAKLAKLVGETPVEATPPAPEPPPLFQPAEPELFKVKSLTKTSDTVKTADQLIEVYGTPAKAIEHIKSQMTAVDADPVSKKEFTAEQRAASAKVIGELARRKDAAGDKRQAEMLSEALRWQGAHMNAEVEYSERKDKRGQFDIANESGKSHLDDYLMKKFGIDRSVAHAITNDITARNLKADRSANVDDFRGEKWADKTIADRVVSMPKSETTTPFIPIPLAKALLSMPPEMRTAPYGDRNASLRQDILEAITGTRPPKSKAGVNVVQEAMLKAAGISKEGKAPVQYIRELVAKMQEMTGAKTDAETDAELDAKIEDATPKSSLAPGSRIRLGKQITPFEVLTKPDAEGFFDVKNTKTGEVQKNVTMEDIRYQNENDGEANEQSTDAITKRPTRITGRVVRRNDARSIYLDAARINQRRSELPRIGGFGNPDLLDSMAVPLNDGTEVVAYRTRDSQVVYKVFKVRNGGRETSYVYEAHTKPDGTVGMVVRSGSLNDALAKIEAINRLGGVPTEIVGINDQGELVVKQPYSPDSESDEFPVQMNQSGAVQVPYNMTYENGWRLWIVSIDGKPMLAADLLPGNFLPDSRGNDRVSDLSITPVPATLLDNPKWKPLIQQAIANEKTAEESITSFQKSTALPRASLSGASDQIAAIAKSGGMKVEGRMDEGDGTVRLTKGKFTIEVKPYTGDAMGTNERITDEQGKVIGYRIGFNTETGAMDTIPHEILGHIAADTLTDAESMVIRKALGMDMKTWREVDEKFATQIGRDFANGVEHGTVGGYTRKVWDKVKAALSNVMKMRFGDAWGEIAKLPNELRAERIMGEVMRGERLEGSAGRVEGGVRNERGAPAESDIISDKEYRDKLRSNYFNKDVKLGDSRQTPAVPMGLKLGQWRRDEAKLSHGREMSQLRLVDPNTLSLSENMVETNEQGRGWDAGRYAEWFKEGKAAPPIEVVETDKGTLRVSDGHRRVAAAKKNGVPVLAWVSPSMDIPSDASGRTSHYDGDASKPIIKTGLTYEAMRDGVAKRTTPLSGEFSDTSVEYPEDYPRFQRADTPTDEDGRPVVRGTKDAINEERKEFGLEANIKQARHKDPEVFRRAEELLARDPNAQKLIKELELEIRSVSDVERAALALVKASIGKSIREHDAHASKMTDEGYTALAKAAELQSQIETSFYDQITQIMDKAGTETGRGLRAIRFDVDYEMGDLVAMKNKARKSQGYKQLTDKQNAEVEKIHEEYQKRITAMEAEIARMKEEGVNSDIGKVIDRMKGEKKPADPEAVHEKTLAKIDRLADEGNGFVDPAKLTGLFQQLARYHVGNGVTERNALVEAVRKDVASIFPEMTHRQVRDAISQYGKTSSMSQEQGDVILRELKRQMTGVSKIEDVMKGQPPLKSGMTRDPISQESRTLTRELHALMKKMGIRMTDPATQLKSSLDAIKTRLTNSIEDLTKAIANHERITTNKDRVAYDAEANALKAERDALRAEYDLIFPKAPITDEQRLIIAKKSAERSLENWEARVAEAQKGIFTEKTEKEGITNPEIDAIRAKRDAAKAEFEALKELANPKPSPEVVALNRYKAEIARAIDAYEKKMASPDFTKKEKTDRPLDEGGRKALMKLNELKQQWKEKKKQYELANAKWTERAAARIHAPFNMTRKLLSSMDLSATLRQGGFIVFGHPVRAFDSFIPSLQSLVSADATMRIDQEIKNRPNAGDYVKAKLFIAEHDGAGMSEENYMRGMTKWEQYSERLPGVKHTQRAYITFLNKLRADSFDAMVQALPEGRKPTLDEMRKIADYINIATGRGNLGKAAVAGQTLADILWSPRLMVSRFQLLYGQPMLGGTAATRKLIALDYARFLTGMAAVYAIGAMAGGEEEPDPRSSDFGKIKFGNTRIDPLAGLAQVTTVSARIVTGRTKTQGGEVEKLRGEDAAFGSGVTGVIGRFLRNKLSPMVGVALNVASGKNAVGESVTPMGVALDMVRPLSVRDIGDVMQEHGVGPGTAMVMLSTLGIGVQNYKNDQYKSAVKSLQIGNRELKDAKTDVERNAILTNRPYIRQREAISNINSHINKMESVIKILEERVKTAPVKDQATINEQIARITAQLDAPKQKVIELIRGVK